MDRTERFRRITLSFLMFVAMYALAVAVGILSQVSEGAGPGIFVMFAVVTFAVMALVHAALALREGVLSVGDLVSPGVGLWLLRVLVLTVLTSVILGVHLAMMSAVQGYFWTPPL